MNGSFCSKCIPFNLKKYRGVILHDTDSDEKFEAKTDLCFGKSYKEF